MTRCLDGDVGCLGEERCLTHGLWHALGRHIATFLSSVTLQEVLDGLPQDKLAAEKAAHDQVDGGGSRPVGWAAAE